VINVARAEVRRLPRDPGQPAEIRDLLLRGRVAEAGGHTMRSSMSEALGLYEEALRRAPRNRTAMLGVSRLTIVAAMNFIDLDAPPDIPRAEKLLNEVLTTSPNSAGAHFVLGILQKYRGQYEAGIQSLQRSLELNPSFLPARGQIGAMLTRMGQPQKGLETLQETIRVATPNDPSMGFWYLFAGDAELELGHEQAALGWILRANTVMPGSPLVQAWLASVYTTMGDQRNAAKYIAALKQMAPAGAERYAGRKFGPIPPNGWPRTRMLEGLRLALAAPSG
jgi:tetratricopeptide (TPR) repeat protein